MFEDTFKTGIYIWIGDSTALRFAFIAHYNANIISIIKIMPTTMFFRLFVISHQRSGLSSLDKWYPERLGFIIKKLTLDSEKHVTMLTFEKCIVAPQQMRLSSPRG